MAKFKKAYTEILSHVGAVLLAGIVIDICVEIISRRLNISLTWTEELARYLFVLLCFTVWPAVILRGSDIVISFLFDKMPLGTRRILLGVMHIVMAAVLVIVFYSAIRLNRVLGNVSAVSMMWLKMRYIYLIVAFDVISALVMNVIRGIEIITGRIPVLTDEQKANLEMEAAKEAVAKEKDPDAVPAEGKEAMR